MTRPHITLEMLYMYPDCFSKAYAGVASTGDYKKVFDEQAFGTGHSLTNALRSVCKADAALTKKVIDYANHDLNYNEMIRNMIHNIASFTNVIVPARDCDFSVTETNVQDTFFWIKERIEISKDFKHNRFYIAKLMVDEESDSLLFHNGEDGWVEYTPNNNRHHKAIPNTDTSKNFSSKVAQAYKEYLAEKQLLKD